MRLVSVFCSRLEHSFLNFVLLDSNSSSNTLHSVYRPWLSTLPLRYRLRPCTFPSPAMKLFDFYSSLFMFSIQHPLQTLLHSLHFSHSSLSFFLSDETVAVLSQCFLSLMSTLQYLFIIPEKFFVRPRSPRRSSSIYLP